MTSLEPSAANQPISSRNAVDAKKTLMRYGVTIMVLAAGGWFLPQMLEHVTTFDAWLWTLLEPITALAS